jgi:hypothetical protein
MLAVGGITVLKYGFIFSGAEFNNDEGSRHFF